ncbi:ABC transporter permease [Natronorubrum sp. DTA28]|uniref:ABC transporter permease n=1 Tax=Natronorubrum sp. DTA28 TaxID=3447019 RepID=UPI003F83378A
MNDNSIPVEGSEGVTFKNGFRRWTRQVQGFSMRSIQETTNSWMLMSVVLGIAPLMQLLFGLQGGFSSETLAAFSIGTAMFGAIYVSLYVFGYQLAGDLESRRYHAYRSMPVSPLADLFGRMAAGIVLAVITFTLTIIVGYATGGAFSVQGAASVPLVAVTLVLTCIFWMVVTIPIVAFAQNKRLAEYVVPIVAVVGYVATGWNGVSSEMSFIDGDVINYLPNTLPTRTIVYHLVGSGDWGAIGVTPPELPAGPEYFAIVFAYALIALVVGTAFVNRVLYRQGWSK